MPDWELAPLGWEAIATFTTGGLAVWAAYRVGRRQIRISKKQTEIADEMRNLEALKVKSDLFDRRLVIFSTTREWLNAFLEAGSRPNLELRGRFIISMEEALFLYGQELFDLMYEWVNLGDEHYLLSSISRNADEATCKSNSVRQLEIYKLLFAASKELHNTFKPALNLSQIL